MAKKKQKQPARRDPPIQFRVKAEVERGLAKFAGEHSMSPNTAAKHLVSLALHQLDTRHFGPVAELSDAMGGEGSFDRVVAYICRAVDARNEELAAEGRSPMNENERQEFIQQDIQSLTKRLRHGVLVSDPFDRLSLEEKPKRQELEAKIYRTED